ncbi:MAG TPA: FAD-dependent oxidoreductase [Dehalococcoidales bacterium]|nr:FAD-dependent oxidoreductase [Dehalococcoidales bacterium]
MEIFGEYDVVVVGGGTAGVAAAIASARAGANTILIERFGALGGQMNVSGPPGFSFAHLWNNYGEQCLAGIVEETHHRLEKEGLAAPYPKPEDRNANAFALVDPDWWGLLIFEMMTENHVNLLLHSLAVDVVKEGDAVKGVIVENTSGRMAVLGKIIVECTGEGDIAMRAGAPYEQVSKDKFEIEPPSISFTMDGVDWEKVLKHLNESPEDVIFQRREMFLDPEEGIKFRKEYLKKVKSINDMLLLGSISYRKLSKELISKGELHPYGDLGFFFTPRQGGRVQAIFQHSSQVHQCNTTDVRDLTAGEVEARRQVVIALKAARKYIPGFENAYLTRITTYLRIRETRRIMGDYKLTLDDVYESKKFKDVIAKSVMTMGGHHVANVDTLSQVTRKGAPKGASFDLPYRILVPQKVENLLVAGKMVSTDRECYLRFLPETMLTGQAAGVAAAVCAKKGVTPRQLEKDIKPVQDILVKQGAILFGTR